MSKLLTFFDGLLARLPQGRPRLPGITPNLDYSSEERTVFVLDHSGSMGDQDYPPSRLEAGVAAIGEYVAARLKSGAYDTMAAVIFDSMAEVICPETSLNEATRNILGPLSRVKPDGGTDIEQGLVAADAILEVWPDDVLKRIILLTDGHGGTPEQRSHQVKEHGIIIDVIGIGGSPADVNEWSLRQVASVISGETRYRFIGDRHTLLNHFRKIATDLAWVR